MAIMVDRADAGDWIEQQLSEPREGRLAVVYHSIFYHYPPPEIRRRIHLTAISWPPATLHGDQISAVSVAPL